MDKARIKISVDSSFLRGNCWSAGTEKNGRGPERSFLSFERLVSELSARFAGERLKTENVYLRQEVSKQEVFNKIISQSDAIRYVKYVVQRVTP